MQTIDISGKIRELRISRNLTQAELGKVLGVSMQAVSKWERGGTPDLAVLLSIVTYFDISLDELFSRSLHNADRLEDLLYNATLSSSDDRRAEQACSYCWSVFKGMTGISTLQNTQYGAASPGDTENSRCLIMSDQGVGYAVATQEAHMVAVMPEPKNGFDVLLGSIENYATFFAMLGDPDNLRLLVFLYTRHQTLFPKKLAAQATGISMDKIDKAFQLFEQRGWLMREKADMEQGPVTLYRPVNRASFLFFLIFANEVISNTRFWFMSSITKRTRPLLKKLPDRSEGN
ncbi:MAG: helix-turn-helix transcriptional regulator [Clostridiaceae bacterium]|nr:helix-turn-helix transcriptional regulator [Clostridiaceae bacterium]